MKKFFPIVTLLASLATGYALADESLPSDSRIKWLNYDESDVYTITTKYSYQTNIVFSEGEEIQTVSVGDRSLWQIIPAGNRLFIRPMDANVITNMTVLTNKHAYQFDLKSIPESKSGNIYVAKFIYPDHRPVPPISAIPPVFPTTPAPMAWHEPPPAYHAPAAMPVPLISHGDEPGITRPVYPNYNYTFSGPDNLAPQQVYDDGKSTFVKYRNMSQIPQNVMFMATDGSEKPAPYTIQDGMITIDSIAPEIVLGSNEGTIHVYNEMLNPK